MEMKDVLNSFKRLYGDFRAAFKQINEWEVEKKKGSREKAAR